MNTQAYLDGFKAACAKAGLTKSASDRLYKEAQWSRLFAGLGKLGPAAREIGGCLWGIGGSLARKLERGAVWLNRLELNPSNSLARSFENGTLGTIPFVRSFGRGFVEANKAGAKSTGIGSLFSALGVGKGGLVGNSVAGLGSFMTSHPLLGLVGTSTFTYPFYRMLDRLADEESTLDTMTPEELRNYRRSFRSHGYNGFDSDDIRSMSIFD